MSVHTEPDARASEPEVLEISYPRLHGYANRAAPQPAPADPEGPPIAVNAGEVPPRGSSSQGGRFGRLFPSLRPLAVDPAHLDELAATMKDPDGRDDAGDNPAIPAGFTYFGQFVDHDLTFDPSPLGTKIVDPASLTNFRTPAFDLDSVYGRGPDDQPYLYESDGEQLLIGITSATSGIGDPNVKPSLPADLPRGPNRRALIGDQRNDENLAVAQTHLALLRFHNRVVAGLRDGTITRTTPLRKTRFEEAHDLVVWHYQWVVVHDFLRRILDTAVLEDVLQNHPAHYHPSAYGVAPYMPVEFSAAAYRFGHSMVRGAYDYNRVFTFGKIPATLGLLFRFTGKSGTDAPIPSDWMIDWNRWYEIDPNRTPNASRRIDPFLARELHGLPVGGGSLPARNLRRGNILELPSGQSVAGFLREVPLTPAEIATGPDGAVAEAHHLHIETPLWYYLLKEAQIRADGKHLGRVGSRIVAEVFIGLLLADATSYLARKPDWVPTLPGSMEDDFSMADLLRFTGELDPVSDPANLVTP